MPAFWLKGNALLCQTTISKHVNLEKRKKKRWKHTANESMLKQRIRLLVVNPSKFKLICSPDHPNRHDSAICAGKEPNRELRGRKISHAVFSIEWPPLCNWHSPMSPCDECLPFSLVFVYVTVTKKHVHLLRKRTYVPRLAWTLQSSYLLSENWDRIMPHNAWSANIGIHMSRV